ncbi:MAG: ATP-dependent sacrificial sulfur transferase LarE [Kiritimatiellia bacterium]
MSKRKNAEGFRPETARRKLEKLRGLLGNMDKTAVALSGGADSSFLAAVAADVLGRNALAVTVSSPVHPERETAEARESARETGIRHAVVKGGELNLPEFVKNPPDRCYHCKLYIYGIVRKLAESEGIDALADGTNADDLLEDRPGLRAIRELGVSTPLAGAGLSKDEIRFLSRELGLSFADRPAFTCLATRFPAGTVITAEGLKAVEAVEGLLLAKGFKNVRARCHGEIVRIEVDENDIGRLCSETVRRAVSQRALSAGFRYVTIDMQGYRQS